MGTGTGTGAAAVPPPDAATAEALPTLAPAPPVPEPPVGLPPVELGVTAEQVALGELLFFEPRIGRKALGACAMCHDPAHGWADDGARSTTLAAKPNLRHTPALANLAWVPELGWDGRFTTLEDAVRAHWKGQLDVEPAEGVAAIAGVPVYRAHFRRASGGPPGVDAAVAALAAFVKTRFQGDSPWDRYERGDRAAAGAEAEAGYVLFTGKAQCSTCHVPPLYTDHAFHRLGLIQSQDEGRGRVDPAASGGFRTPTLRGATLHPPYFHDGSAATLEAAVDWHLAGGTGQGAGVDVIDPALVPVALSDVERSQLLAFLRALSPAAVTYRPPELPP
jgi:cytochrome c peroxidase